MIERESTRLDGDYTIGGLTNYDRELTITVHNGSVPFTFREVEDVVGKPVRVNGAFDFVVKVARHTEGGWGVVLTMERMLPEVAKALQAGPLPLEERFELLADELAGLRGEHEALKRRLDATISIAAREAVERIRKQIARAVGDRW